MAKKNINTPDYWDKRYERISAKRIVTGNHIDLYSTIVERIAFFNPERIIDWGIGCGAVPYALEKAGWELDCYKYVGIDFSPEGLQEATRNLDIMTYEAYIDKPMSKDLLNKLHSRFDVAVCVEVLEHLTDYNITLKNMYNSLKSSGKGIVTVPSGKISIESHVHHNIKPSVMTKAHNQAGLNVIQIMNVGRWNVYISEANY